MSHKFINSVSASVTAAFLISHNAKINVSDYTNMNAECFGDLKFKVDFALSVCLSW